MHAARDAYQQHFYRAVPEVEKLGYLAGWPVIYERRGVRGFEVPAMASRHGPATGPLVQGLDTRTASTS